MKCCEGKLLPEGRNRMSRICLSVMGILCKSMWNASLKPRAAPSAPPAFESPHSICTQEVSAITDLKPDFPKDHAESERVLKQRNKTLLISRDRRQGFPAKLSCQLPKQHWVQMWWLMPLVLRRKSQPSLNSDLQTSEGYTEGPCFKNKQQSRNQQCLPLKSKV